MPELEHYWEIEPDTGFGLGLFPQSMTRERFKFISKHIAITSPAEIEENDRYRGRRDPLGRIRWLIDSLNAQFGKCRQSPRAQSIDESMVKFKGLNKASISSSIRQRMKDKPIKRKLHVLKQKATRTDSKSIKA